MLYAGEVNWDAAGLGQGQPKRIEHALGSGQSVLVQVTKDPIGHKGARLTSQISLPGRYLVYVPDSSMTGISRKLPDTERARLKRILKEVVPDSAGVIVRTAAEGASEEELRADVERLTRTWEEIQAKAEAAGNGKGRGKGKGGSAPLLLHGEPDLTVRVIRDVFNEDFTSLVVAGEQAWNEVSDYVGSVAPDLADRVSRWTGEQDLFTHHRVDEQLVKAMDRKVWLPSGGSLVIDRTEAMTVIDVNTGKFVGSGGNLEETVTKNNLEAAEEIVRQLRLRDIGGIIVVDFIDMVLEANRDLVVRRLLECLGRDRTKHQVAEVTSLGLVQMTPSGSGPASSRSSPSPATPATAAGSSSTPTRSTGPPVATTTTSTAGGRTAATRAAAARAPATEGTPAGTPAADGPRARAARRSRRPSRPSPVAPPPRRSPRPRTPLPSRPPAGTRPTCPTRATVRWTRPSRPRPAGRRRGARVRRAGDRVRVRARGRAPAVAEPEPRAPAPAPRPPPSWAGRRPAGPPSADAPVTVLTADAAGAPSANQPGRPRDVAGLVARDRSRYS